MGPFPARRWQNCFSSRRIRTGRRRLPAFQLRINARGGDAAPLEFRRERGQAGLIVAQKRDELIGRPQRRHIAMLNLQRDEPRRPLVFQTDGDIGFRGDPTRSHGRRCEQEDEDAARLQAAVDRLAPLLAWLDTVGRDPHGPAARLQVGRQPVREPGILVCMSDENPLGVTPWPPGLDASITGAPNRWRY